MNTSIAAGVPLIDLSGFPGDSRELAAIDSACADWGFFQVIGHGLDTDLLNALFEQMHRFFTLPPDRKRAIQRNGNNPWGFYDCELTKNIRDNKEIFDVGPQEHEGPMAGASPQWPDDLPGFQAAVEEYYSAASRLSFTLLHAVCVNLGVQPEFLDAHFSPTQTSFVRLNYYPAAASNGVGVALGINPHTDAGALTVLAQDTEPGLQVWRNAQWHTIVPVPGALVINIGDIVQVWSNDRYVAPLHRVLGSASRPRYSAPFFFNPAYSTDYAPLSTVANAALPPRYRSINWGEFRAGRAAGDYANLGEEIQISQFRLN